MPRQAPLTKNDIRIIFQEENKPIVALLEIHEKAIQTNTQFLFGANGNNGLNSEYKGIKERLLAVETEQNKGTGRKDVLVALGGGTLAVIFREVIYFLTNHKP